MEELNELESKRVVEQDEYEADRINRHEATRVRNRIHNLQGLLSREDGEQEHLDSLQTAKSDLESQIATKEERVDRRNELSEAREYLGVITELLKTQESRRRLLSSIFPLSTT